MPPLLKFLTLPAILLTLIPRATPGKASEFPEKWIIVGFYAVIGWSLLGAPNWNKVSAPKISPPQPPSPQPTQSVPVTTFTTATTTTPVNPVAQSRVQSGVLVLCPSSIEMVNIRQSAGLTGVVATVPCGDRVTVTSTDRISSNTGIWIPIDYKGTQGWATARYLDVKI